MLNQGTINLLLDESVAGNPAPTVIQNVIITPTGKAAAFWNKSNDPEKLFYAFTNDTLNGLPLSTKGSFTLPKNGSGGATGLTAISLATNAKNQVVVAWDLGADSSSTNPVSQFAVFDANGTLTEGQTNLFAYGEIDGFSPSDSEFTPPKVAIDKDGTILFGQYGNSAGTIFKTFFK